MFTLHPRLTADCITLGHFPLCRVLLLNDARYPWFILVPQRDAITESYQLSEGDQHQLMKESARFGRAVMDAFGGDKLNIGALGNMVPQLHIHHIVRFKEDPAWPGAVWGHGQAAAYSDSALSAMIDKINALNMDAFSPAR